MANAYSEVPYFWKTLRNSLSRTSAWIPLILATSSNIAENDECQNPNQSYNVLSRSVIRSDLVIAVIIQVWTSPSTKPTNRSGSTSELLTIAADAAARRNERTTIHPPSVCG